MVGVLVVASGTGVVAGEVVAVAPTIVVVIEHLDIRRPPTATAAATVADVPTVFPNVAVATTIPNVAPARFLLLAPIFGVIIVPPIVPHIFIPICICIFWSSCIMFPCCPP